MTKVPRILLFSVAILSVVAAAAPAPQSSAEHSSRPTLPTENNSSPSNGAFDQPRHLLQQGKYDDALAALQDIEARHPATKGLPHELGVAYYKKGDYLKAINYLQKARDENPDDGEAVQLLGLSFYLAGRPGDAIAPLEK